MEPVQCLYFVPRNKSYCAAHTNTTRITLIFQERTNFLRAAGENAIDFPDFSHTQFSTDFWMTHHTQRQRKFTQKTGIV